MPAPPILIAIILLAKSVGAQAAGKRGNVAPWSGLKFLGLGVRALGSRATNPMTQSIGQVSVSEVGVVLVKSLGLRV